MLIVLLIIVGGGILWYGCSRRDEDSGPSRILIEGSNCSVNSHYKLSKSILTQLHSMVDSCEQKLSLNRKNSQIAKINDAAGLQPVEVDNEVMSIVRKSLNFARLSQGRYDPSAAPLYSLWRTAIEEGREPSRDDIYSLLEKVNYRRITMDIESNQVFISEKGMQISMEPGIDGYTVDKVTALLHQHNLSDICISKGIVQCTNQNEIVLYESEGQREGRGSLPVIKLKGTNFHAFAELHNEGRLLLNLTTGYPVKTGICCVATFGPDAYAAEVLAHIVASGMIVSGISLVEEIPFFEVVCFTEDREVFCTSGIRRYIEDIHPEYTLHTFD